jgi:hypothetical protein
MMSRSRNTQSKHVRRRGLRLLPVLLLLAAGLAAGVGPAGGLAADIVVKDPHGIACPNAPSGWFNPPGDSTATTAGGRSIIAPGTVVTAGEGPQGGNTVNVSCDYFTKAGKHLVVDLLYALPTDPNPINDFYFGCRSGGTSWTKEDRVFRLMSIDQWAAVAFYDSLEQLGSEDVPGFETVARQLLRNSEGYAHQCTLKVQPSPLQTRWQFTFGVSAGKVKGLFWTQGAKTDSVLPVVAVGIEPMTLNVKSNGARHPLTVQVTRGVSYMPQRAGTRGQLRLAVSVTKSNVPGCPNGSTGTLIVTTAPSALLKVCSRSFLKGPATATIAEI